MILKVPARYFSPAPKVDSAIIAINNISRKFFIDNAKSVQGSTLNKKAEGVNEEKFWEIVRTGFMHKRKKLSGNLKNKVENAPNTGVKASKSKNHLVFWMLFLWVNIRVTVFIPSVKSCAITAIATSNPTEGLT